MAGNNDFLPFGTAATAPVLTQAAYAALSPANGYGPGILPKENFNKAIRQGAVMASAFGAFIASQGFNANDDGNVPGLQTSILDALLNLIQANVLLLSASGVPYGFKIGNLVVQIMQVTFTDVPSGQPGYTGTLTYPYPLTTQCFGIFPGFQVLSGGSALNNFQFALAGPPGLTTAAFQIQEWSSGVNPGTLNIIIIGY